jgi:hypothetical protein
MDDKDASLPAVSDRVMHEISHVSVVGRATAVIALLAVLGLAYRLLAERQRRSTFDHIFTSAPGGSVIFQEKSVAGPAMWVWVGEVAQPVVRDRVERVVVVMPTPAMSSPAERGWSAARDA